MMDTWQKMSALALGSAIEAGSIDPRELTEYFIEKIHKIDTENSIYLRTTQKRAEIEANSAYLRAKSGMRLSPLDGVPISWKDLFETVGDITSHGSPVLLKHISALDAKVVQRAVDAGLICLGKTNQTEYAFSILGINPHFGTPQNPFDLAIARLPGGSTSGGAVSVSRGLASAAIGSDTGGSVRVPAAWNGLVGLKTSFGRLPLNGVLPLSKTLDTVGPLTHDVADSAAFFSVLDGRLGPNKKPWVDISNFSIKAISFICPKNLVWEDLDSDIKSQCKEAIKKLDSSGAFIKHTNIPELSEIDDLISHFGPYHASECHAVWGNKIEASPDQVYPPILERIRLGGLMKASNVEQIKTKLADASKSLVSRIGRHGIIVCPTVPIGPPTISEVENSSEKWTEANAVVLRNTRLANFLNCCSITLPCGLDDNGIPVGLMLMAPWGEDERLLRIAAAIEKIICI